MPEAEQTKTAKQSTNQQNDKAEKLNSDFADLMRRHESVLTHWDPKSQKEGKDELRKDLEKFLERSNLAISVRQTGSQLVVEAHDQAGVTLRANLELKDGKIADTKIAGINIDTIMRYGLQQTPANLGALLREKGSTQLSPAESDPRLKQHLSSFQELESANLLESNGSSQSTQIKSRTAALISRHLHNSGLDPTPHNVASAYKTIAKNQDAHRNTTLFDGSSVLLAAHAESQYPGNAGINKDPRLPEAIDQSIRFAGDANMFGRRVLQDALRAQSGASKENFRFVRPDYKPLTELEQLGHLARKHGDALATWPKEGKLSDAQQAFQTEARKMFGDEKLQIGRAELPDNKGFQLQLLPEKKDRELPLVDVLQSEGKTEFRLGSPNFNPEEYQRIIAAAKNDTRESYRTMPPGQNNSFAFVFDGHGSGPAIHFAGGLPIQTDKGVKIETRGPESMITAEELAEDIVARHQRFPKKPGDKPDVCVVGACVSGDFITKVAEKINNRAPVPIMIAATDFQELSTSDVDNPIGSRFIESVIDPQGRYRSTKPSDEEISRLSPDANDGIQVIPPRSLEFPWGNFETKFGEVLDYLQNGNTQIKSKPSIIVPNIETTEGQPSWIQVSGTGEGNKTSV